MMKLLAKSLVLSVGVALAVPALAFTVNISEPVSDRAYIFPAQNIDVTVTITPQPRPEYTLLIVFDEQVVGNNQTTLSLPTSEYGLGNHTLKAILYNDQAQPIAQDERMVYVIPRSNLAREREAKEQAQAAYDALPWYKKVYVNMRQGDNSLTINPAANPASSTTLNTTTANGTNTVINTGVNAGGGVQSGNGVVGFGTTATPMTSGFKSSWTSTQSNGQR